MPFPGHHATEFLAERLLDLDLSRRVNAGVALHSHVQGEERRRQGIAGRRLAVTDDSRSPPVHVAAA
jgi:hypothetical protein